MKRTESHGMPRTEHATDTLPALTPAAAVLAALTYLEAHRRLNERQAEYLCDMLRQSLADPEPAADGETVTIADWPPTKGGEAAEFGGIA